MNVFDLFARISLDTGDYERGLEDAGEKTSSFGSKLKSGLSAVAKAGGAAIAASTAAVTAFAKSSVSTGMQFDASMSQVAATMGVTTDEIQDLRDFAMDMGAKTAFSATQAADALNFMALAGYDAETSMKMLPNVLNLAAAGGIELAAASDMVTDAQSALGLSLDETSELVDKMAKASSKSNTSVAQLGDAILTIGGTAKNLAGGTTELATALGILADNGVKGAEGGTALRNIILSLSAPTDTAAKAMAALGLEVYDAQGNMRPLNETFGDLQAALSTMTQGQQTQALNEIFNKVDLKSVNALLANTGERFDELSGYIDDASESAANMADTQLGNLSGDITLFKSALEGAQIVLSDQLTPKLREFVQFGSSGISQIADAFKEGGLSGAMEAFGNVLSEGLNTIIETLPEMTEAGMRLLGALGQGLLDNLPTLLDSAMEIIMMLVDGLISNAPQLLQAAFQIITTLALKLSEMLPELIPSIIGIILELIDVLTDPDNLSMLIDAAIAILIGLAEGLINSLPELLEKAPVILANLVQAIIDNVPKLLQAAYQIIFKLAAGIVENLPQLAKSAFQIITTLGSKIIENLPKIGESARKIIEKVVSGITEVIYKVKNVGKSIVEGLWEGIQSMVTWIGDKVSGFFSGIVDGAKNLLGINSPSRVFADMGKNMALGLGEGWEDNFDRIRKDIEDSMTFDSPEIGVSMAGEGQGKAGAGLAGYSGNAGSTVVNQYIQAVPMTPSELARQSVDAFDRLQWA